MNAFDAGVTDAMTKCAWFGTYYHGTTPKAEKAIMGEGLKTSKAGTGAVAGAERAGLHMGNMKKRVKGKVTMSRSKTLAKLYGTLRSPKFKSVLNKDLTDLKQAREIPKETLRQFIEHQPLQVKGHKGKLTRDPDHLLLGVQSAKNIPASAISKAKQSRLGRFLAKKLAKR